jgi:hypothetical protein
MLHTTCYLWSEKDAQIFANFKLVSSHKLDYIFIFIEGKDLLKLYIGYCVLVFWKETCVLICCEHMSHLLD